MQAWHRWRKHNMVTEITKDGDVRVTRKREEGQRIQVQNSWISGIIMLISFMFVVVTGRLNYIYADEGELMDNLFTGQRKEDSEYLMKFEHTLEPKKLLQTQYQKTWLKGLFKKRTLPRIISWVSAANLQKKQQGESSWTRSHEEFQAGESDAGAQNEVIYDFTRSRRTQ